MTIQVPTYDHIEEIRELNNKYLITNLTEKEKQNGFLRIEYDQKDLQLIIANEEIIIATNEDKVIGYYLIGRKSGKVALDSQKNIATRLLETYNIPFEQIGYGAQRCVNENYRGNGISYQMLSKLCQVVKFKYPILLGFVSIENVVSLKTNLHDGWKQYESNFYIFENF